MDEWNGNERLRCFRSCFLMTVRVFTYLVDVISLIRSSLMNFPVSPLTLNVPDTRLYHHLYFYRASHFGVHLDPKILASCRYFNLPYFQLQM